MFNEEEMRDHMIAWGCPEAYAQDWPDYHGPFARDIREVSAAANWHEEQNRALGEMCRRRDVDAIRAWNRDALVSIGEQTGESGAEYANEVIRALTMLARAVVEEADIE